MNYYSTGIVLVFSAFYAAFVFWFNGYLPFYTDEAYYYLWSRHLSMGYLDHPAMIAYAIKAATVFGDTAQTIRTVNIVSFFGAAAFVYLSAEYLLKDKKAAVYSFFIFILSPAATMGLSITTPDSPLVLFWSAALYFGARAFFEDKTSLYAVTGGLIGLAMLSKYTAVLIAASLVILITIKKPKLYLTKKPYIAIVAALIAFSPTLIWNIQNGFEGFLFQYGHGSGDGAKKLLLLEDLEFFGGMFAVFSPIFFGILLYGFIKKESYKNDKLFFAVLPALFTIVFFLYKGLYKKMELNWVAPAFISASIVASYYISRQNLKKLFWAGIVVSIGIACIARFPVELGLTGAKNPHERLFGFKELAAKIESIDKTAPVFADHLTTASILWFELKKEVFIPTETRVSEFDRWQKNYDFASKNGIYVSKDDKMEELKKIWKNTTLIEEFRPKKEGFREKTFYIYRVSN